MSRLFPRYKARSRDPLAGAMTDGERRAIELSLAADIPELQALRAQLEPPTFNGVRRLPADVGYFLLIYRDGDAPETARASVADFTIEDLFVTDSDGALWHVRTHVHNGWLGPIDLVREGPPGPLQSVSDHYYGDPGNTVRRDITVPVVREGSDDPPDLEDGEPPTYLRKPGFARDVKTNAPATDAVLQDAGRRLATQLPEFLGELLRWSNGGAMNGVELLSAADLYLLDAGPNDAARRIVFALEDGDPHVVVLPANEQTVLEVWDHETGGVREVYTSAEAWAEYVVQP